MKEPVEKTRLRDHFYNYFPALEPDERKQLVARISIGLSASLIIGLMNPGFEPSMETEARGDPDVLELLIALASGTAGNLSGLYGSMPCRETVP